MTALHWLLFAAMIHAAPPDSAQVKEASLNAVEAILADSATALFLRREAGIADPLTIAVAESLYTLDRFPFDAFPGDTAVSVYKADMLRPLRSIHAPWLSRFRRALPPTGRLFLSPIERGAIVAELFVFDPHAMSYEAYCIASNSLKFLVRITRGNRAVIAGRVRLLR